MRQKFGAGNAGGMANHYKQVGLQTKAEVATPHAMVLMLLSGAVARIAEAKGCIDRKEISRKGELLSSAIKIIDTLQSSLDKKHNPVLVENLEVVYLLAIQEILRCNLDNDAAGLDGVIVNLRAIKEAWEQIPPQ